MPERVFVYRAVMELLKNKKIAIPLIAGLGVLAIGGAFWGISQMPPSGGIQTTAVKGEAAVKAGADADTAALEQMSAEDLKVVVKQRKATLDAAESYKIENDIKIAKESLERAEAVLKTK